MKSQTQITRKMSIEDLVEFYPFAIHYLAQKGIRCVVCGEPVWLSLEEAARERGFSENEIDEVVNELRMMAVSEDNYNIKSTGEKECFYKDLKINDRRNAETGDDNRKN